MVKKHSSDNRGVERACSYPVRKLVGSQKSRICTLDGYSRRGRMASSS